VWCFKYVNVLEEHNVFFLLVKEVFNLPVIRILRVVVMLLETSVYKMKKFVM
jgi:hypothetical protein